jgi:hypothetical protein
LGETMISLISTGASSVVSVSLVAVGLSCSCWLLILTPLERGEGVLSPVELFWSLSSLASLHTQILKIEGMVTSFEAVALSRSVTIRRTFALSPMKPATVMFGLVLVPQFFLHLGMN